MTAEKLGMCIDIVEIWFWIVMGKFHQFLTKLSACDMSEVSFPDDNEQISMDFHQI